jgi:transposase-like protein
MEELKRKRHDAEFKRQAVALGLSANGGESYGGILPTPSLGWVG